ncbi:hypothetical protein CR162_18035 [Pseudoroseomonas rhizosphaerae]|uniref:Uncharacterized protein n=1 Tax=Teichococcus rhizosphaerae TaxID=1335062 RepID=A0A2C7AA76_9PROT|nr:hypothetical protein CR162_18035 [Pseudoroseomonas rhizosphaerae]
MPPAPDHGAMRAGLLSLVLLALPPLLALPAAAQAPRPATADARGAEAERLLDALPAAPDETAGAALAARIRALWAQGASPAVTLLLQRGHRNLEAEAPGEAVEDFDAALTLQPGHAEAWLMRAQALAATGDMQAAMSDLQQVLVLQPRHFVALTLLSSLREQVGDRMGALRAMEEAVSLHPTMPGAAARLRVLHNKAHGTGT